MSKQFGQAGAGSGMGIDLTKMGSSDGSSGILAMLGHGDPSGDAGDHASPADTSGDGSTPPILGDHQTDSDQAGQRKKIDWKGLIKKSLDGADEGDEDPLAILQMHQSNQNSYMNPRVY